MLKISPPAIVQLQMQLRAFHNVSSIGTTKDLENLTGNNTQQFNNSALVNFITGISEKVSNFTGNLVGNQTGNQTGNKTEIQS